MLAFVPNLIRPEVGTFAIVKFMFPGAPVLEPFPATMLILPPVP